MDELADSLKWLSSVGGLILFERLSPATVHVYRGAIHKIASLGPDPVTALLTAIKNARLEHERRNSS